MLLSFTVFTSFAQTPTQQWISTINSGTSSVDGYDVCNFPDYFDQSFSKIKKDPMKIFSLRPQSLKEDLNSLKENFVISIVYKKKEKQKITKAVQNLYQFFDFYLVTFQNLIPICLIQILFSCLLLKFICSFR